MRYKIIQKIGISFYLYLRNDKVTGTLFDCNLFLERVRHFPSVPVETSDVVVVTIEEVHFSCCFLYPWVQEEHFQKCPSSAFAHTNYDCLKHKAKQT